MGYKKVILGLICLIIIAILILISSIRASALTYYFSAISGDDARTSTQAQSQSTPWRTTAKFNSFFPSLSPGDKVLFKRGETFVGFLVIGRSGTSGNPITIGAYGETTLAKPIITSLVSVTSWDSIGVNKWESSGAVSTLNNMKVCVKNGVLQRWARYPNSTYLSVDNSDVVDFRANNTITDAGFNTNSVTDLNDGQIVVRDIGFALEHAEINAHNGTTITFGPGLNYPPIIGWGYFVQRYASALDVEGEFYYNPTTKKVRIFNVGVPTNVKVATLDSLVYATAKSFITIDNIDFQGANSTAIDIRSSENLGTPAIQVCNPGDDGARSNSITIQNCNISYAGFNGIKIFGNSVIVDACRITNILNEAIRTPGGGKVRNCYLYNIAIIPGMNGNCAAGSAIQNGSAGAINEYNYLRNIGFQGIKVGTKNSLTQYNVIDSFCLNRDDGGGIYVQGNEKHDIYTNSIVRGNIVMNGGFGASSGTTHSIADVYGIYGDDALNGWRVEDNTVFNVVRAGIFLHGNKNDTILRNTVYNCGQAQFFMGYSGWGWNVTGMMIRKNIFVARVNTQQILRFNHGSSDNFANYASSDRNIDSNWYARPIDTSISVQPIVYTEVKFKPPVGKYSLASWRSTAFGSRRYDFNTKAATKKIANTNKIRIVYNDTRDPLVVSLDSQYVSIQGENFNNGFITLAPFSSKVLLTNGVRTGGNIPPTVSITTPVNGTLYTAPATIYILAAANDADGTISRVEFYNGGTLLSTDLAAPYEYTWTGVPISTYSLTAKAFDNSGDFTISASASGPVNNALPVVNITSPSNGNTFIAPANIFFKAVATDANGTISNVKFYYNGILFQTEVTAPHEFTRSFPNPGTYILTTVATDNNGGETTSDPITFYVSATANASPTVDLTNPVNNDTLSNPADINLSATATDIDGNIVSVKFYEGATLLNTDVTAPYSFNLDDVGIGTYSYTAVATDDDGAVDTSSVITVTVENIAPTVNITSPVTGERFETPGSILFVTDASDANGTITDVKFYNGETLISIDVVAPYEFLWTGVAAGSYSVTAIATDNNGAVDTSDAIIVHVENTLPAISLSSTITDNIAPGQILLEATASDANGTITKVEFFADSVLLFSDVTTPYSYTWTGVQEGVYEIYAEVTDNEMAIVSTSTEEVEILAGSVSISDLNHVYDGTPKPVTVTVDGGYSYAVTYSDLPDPPTDAGTYTVVATVNDGIHSGTATATLIIAQADPILAWDAPDPITYPDTLSATQLNPTANVPGTFGFYPSSGTVLEAGVKQLKAAFTPTDIVNYNEFIEIVTNIQVNKATAVLTITSASSFVYDGTPKTATATVSPTVDGVTIRYNGSLTPPTAIGVYIISVTLENTNYEASTVLGSLEIIAPGVIRNYLLLNRTKIVNLP